jgi:hypothetical protein
LNDSSSATSREEKIAVSLNPNMLGENF